MTHMKSIVGALSIMMASGIIADFDVSESDSEVYVRVWPAEGSDGDHLKSHVAAVLPPYVDERQVSVVSTQDLGT